MRNISLMRAFTEDAIPLVKHSIFILNATVSYSYEAIKHANKQQHSFFFVVLVESILNTHIHTHILILLWPLSYITYINNYTETF